MQEIAAWFNSFKGLLNLWQAAILFHDKTKITYRLLLVMLLLQHPYHLRETYIL